MKNLFFLIILVFFSFQEQDLNPGLTTVERQMGVGIYIYSIPVRDYDTIGIVRTKKNFFSYPGTSVEYQFKGITGAIDDLARKTMKKAKKDKSIDGLITIDCKQAIAIKFKTEVNNQNYNKAKPRNYKGYWIFVQSKPTHQFTNDKKITINPKFDLSKDDNMNFEQLLDELIKLYEASFDSVQPKANAILTSNGIEADFVTLK